MNNRRREQSSVRVVNKFRLPLGIAGTRVSLDLLSKMKDRSGFGFVDDHANHILGLGMTETTDESSHENSTKVGSPRSIPRIPTRRTDFGPTTTTTTTSNRSTNDKKLRDRQRFCDGVYCSLFVPIRLALRSSEGQPISSITFLTDTRHHTCLLYTSPSPRD